MSATNLPSARVALIGRDAEVGALATAVRSATGRLVTVTGCGGSGKTSLAVAATRRVLPDFPDGGWFCDLSGWRSADELPAAVAAAVGLRERPQGDFAADLRAFLHDRRVLVVLDNCEHLIDAVAALAGSLLDAAPALRLLATSREPLRIAGEQVFPLAPLAIPPAVETVEDLEGFPSVELFLERARAAAPDLTLAPANAAAVAEICRRLDGIPLAIELAAVRASTMTLDSMAGRLAGGFDLLIAKGRSRPERHQTMRAMLEWSHDLLSGEERVVFRRLGVFPASWTVDAAAAVCAEPDGAAAVPLLVGDLVDKSLVVLVTTEGEARYRLLAPVREYAAGRLAASGEHELVKNRHRAFYVALAERAEPEIHRGDQAVWIRRLDADLDNLRLAVRTSHGRGDAESALRLAGALWWYVWQRGHLREGLAWLEPAIGRPEVATAARIAGLRASAMWHGALGHQDRAAADARQLHEVSRTTGDVAQLARAETLLGLERLRSGDLAGTRPHFEAAVAAARAAGDDVIVAHSLVNLGHVAAVDRDAADAEDLVRQGLAQFEANGDSWGVAYASNYLSSLARARGDFAVATETSGRAVGLLHELGDRFYLIFAVEDLARALAGGRRPETAARLLGAADAIRRSTGAPISPGARREYDATVAQLEEALGAEAFRRARSEGAARSIDELLREAMTPPAPAADRAALAGPGGALTRRELEVARLMAAGRSNKEIAAALVIAVGTAGIHVEHILRKLDLRSRHQVGDWARDRGLV
ncbi:MAG TPA: LuxR C-terminal-related transcriptional regulator [Acidimicrobiales bacterium]|nr:LuxR C-terminal-related transcriptional regulator [Acidimicrobiales bacterium]